MCTCFHTDLSLSATSASSHSGQTGASGLEETPSGGSGISVDWQSPPHGTGRITCPFPRAPSERWNGGCRCISHISERESMRSKKRYNVKHFSCHPPPLCHPPASHFSLSFLQLCYYHLDHYQAHSPLAAMERRASRPHGFGERFLTAAAQGWGAVGGTKTRGPIKSI